MHAEIDAPLGGITFARFFPSDWRSGCFGLNLEEEGLYIRACAWMYDTGQAIPGNDATAARLLNVQVQKYSKVMGSLCDKGKMIRAQGVLINRRVFDEIDKYRAQQAARSEAAKRREQERKDRLTQEATDAIVASRTKSKSEGTPRATPPPTPPSTPQAPPPRLVGGYPLSTPQGSIESYEKKLNEINETSAQSCQSGTTAVADTGKARSQKPEARIESHQSSSQSSSVAALDALLGRLGLNYQQLQDRLLGAANGAMADPAVAQGLANLSIPLMWLERGADLERDVLPAIAEVAGRRKRSLTGSRINNWSYFTNAVAACKERREAGLPTGSLAPASAGSEPSTDRWHRKAIEKTRGA